MVKHKLGRDSGIYYRWIFISGRGNIYIYI